jgi:hypothetical protein
MSAVYALYPNGESAERAVRGLRAAGISDREISVISSVPLEDCDFSHLNSETWLWYTACAGAAVGCLFGTWLTRTTQLSWPLPTGNMPIVSWWTNLIVIFELTMLGAILATVVTLVISGGLLRRMPGLYDPEVSEGMILVGVEHPRDSARPDVERALRVGPGVRLKFVPPREQ